jgi:serine/threonine protein kinase
MLREAEKSAAFLAVSRNQLPAAASKQAFEQLVQTCGQGTFADFLDKLVLHKLLTTVQAQHLKVTIPSQELESQSIPTAAKKTRSAPSDIPLAPTQMALRPGVEKWTPEDEPPMQQIGDYRILRKLGQGGMCPVYLGFHEREHRRVAIKILPPKLAEVQANVDRFIREATTGSFLNHPNIVRNFAFGQDPVSRHYFLVMEYVDGPSVLDLLSRQSPLDIGDAVRIILDIARGLEHAHSRNIIHRDIKPDNILLTQTGVAKLADMGLAKRTDENSTLTAARQGFGTPHYMPYEQAVNAKYADGRSDIYALGATLYHLITGEVPFPGETHLEILEKKEIGDFLPACAVNPAVSEELDEILEIMLAKEPQDRYQTVSELIVMLDRANVAAPVLSFVDRKMAFQDPVVRERLAIVPQPTRPDLQKRNGELPIRPKTNPNIWYLRYKVRKNQWCKAKATTQQIHKRLRQKKIPMDAQVSSHADGNYQPLKAVPEFQSYLHRLGKNPQQPTPLIIEAPATEPVPPVPAKPSILEQMQANPQLTVAIFLSVILIFFVTLFFLNSL